MSATPQPTWEPPGPPPGAGPTPRQIRDLEEIDRTSRVGRTVTQVGIPTAVVTIASWAAGLADLDLDPGAGTDMPAEIVAAWVAALTSALAWWMNRRRPRPRGDAGKTTIEFVVMVMLAVLIGVVILVIIDRYLGTPG